MTEMVNIRYSELRAVMTLDAPLPFVTRRASDSSWQYCPKKAQIHVFFILV
jgi:hypothetical protein